MSNEEAFNILLNMTHETREIIGIIGKNIVCLPLTFLNQMP